MYQDKKYSVLDQIGFDSKYIFTIDGKIYNTETEKEIKHNGYVFTLKTIEGKYKSISLKTLYRKIFNKEYCIDNIENLNNETWKYIDNTDNKYLISSSGRVKSLKRYEAKILEGYDTGEGYLKVKINSKNRAIHNLVATGFIENDQPDIKDTIDHISGDKLDNRSDNLQWLSRADNIKKYYQQQRDKK